MCSCSYSNDIQLKCVFAGAGKTYTMLGSFEHPGLTFLMAMELYNRINGMANEYESEIVVSYLEVYNEVIEVMRVSFVFIPHGTHEIIK